MLSYDWLTCKVKHGNGEHVADGPAENAGAVENLAEPIDSVFKPEMKLDLLSLTNFLKGLHLNALFHLCLRDKILS